MAEAVKTTPSYVNLLYSLIFWNGYTVKSLQSFILTKSIVIDLAQRDSNENISIPTWQPYETSFSRHHSHSCCRCLWAAVIDLHQKLDILFYPHIFIKQRNNSAKNLPYTFLHNEHSNIKNKWPLSFRIHRFNITSRDYLSFFNCMIYGVFFVCVESDSSVH